MLSLIQLGSNPRMERVLQEQELQPLSAEQDLRGKRIVFAVAVDEAGPAPEFYAFLRQLRQNRHSLDGACACVVVDGTTELHTKAAAQELVLAANLAGCCFPGRPLVEATGSLYNQHILARSLNLSWQQTYEWRVRDLLRRLREFRMPTFHTPNVLLIHASDRKRSNSLEMGRAICSRLEDTCRVREIQLLNGTVHDCRGCSYQACLHFAENNTCFYGGVVADEVLPAIREADLLLFLCPNYNDALGANLVALINRMTALVVQKDLSDKYLGAVVVSGYSGGDLVARQLMGAMHLNRGCILPPNFCLMQTANDPGDAMKAFGVSAIVERYAEQIKAQLLVK